MSGLSAMSVEYLSQTANGSYILPNGTIVLVPEDVDAYVTGTLVFRVKDFTKRFSKPIDNYRFLAIKSTH